MGKVQLSFHSYSCLSFLVLALISCSFLPYSWLSLFLSFLNQYLLSLLPFNAYRPQTFVVSTYTWAGVGERYTVLSLGCKNQLSFLAYILLSSVNSFLFHTWVLTMLFTDKWPGVGGRYTDALRGSNRTYPQTVHVLSLIGVYYHVKKLFVRRVGWHDIRLPKERFGCPV
jgi:hypothetical protein